MEQGIEIGRRARELYPEGVLIDDPDMPSASKKTRSLIDDSNISKILEGVFLIDGFVAKADILKKKSDDGWHMIEVKSSVNDKAEFIDDMAYTAMVINQSGLNISNVSLMLVSKDFRLGMKNKDLFVEIDHTDEVLNRVEVFKPFWEPIEKITRKSVKPESKLCFECRKCELFEECLGRDIENHIFDLPQLSQSKFDKLMELGIVRIDDIPNGFPLTENQNRVKDCVQLKKPFIGNLKNEMKCVSWPASFLDFETVMTAIPLYPDIAPYTQIPTQYSIHKCSEPGHVISHLQYLADPSKDCGRELAEHLINDLKGEGSIIVYTNFEKNIINSLRKACPHLSGELNLLINRLVDLHAIIKKNFYHPDFHGGTSIKTVLLALVPDISYDELEIADGDTAMATFAYLALGRYENTEVESIKSSLLEYCKQDTLAEVKLHQRLVEDYV
jgi:CRISPR/Cas system-associated exonuclease Cas4 (RecB family)